MVAEVGPVWQARQDARRQQRPRQRAVGAGARYKLVFVDRLLVTLVHLRHATTHDVLAAWFGVDRSTITRAINEIRPLLVDRGCRIDSGVRLRTIADVVAYLDHTKLTGLMDATEVRVRRPTKKRAGRKQFISGKSRQHAMKALIISDARGRVLFGGASCRGSTADITQARQAGVIDWLDHTPPKHQKKQLERMPGIAELRDAQRKAHSRRRVRVEHTIAHLKNWRSLTRHLGHRTILDDTIRAIAGLLSDHQHSQPTCQPVAALPPDI